MKFKILKNNFMSLVFVVGLILIGGIFAGNVFVRQGNVDIDEDLNASNVLFVDSTNGRVGIGIANPLQDLQVGNSFVVNITGKKVGVGTFTPEEYNSTLVVAGGSPQLTVAANSIGAFVNLEQRDNVAYITRDDGDTIVFGVKANSGTSAITPHMTINTDGFVGIGTTVPSYPLHVGVSTSTANKSISIYALKNISATGYITRTSVFDKSQGNALDKIKDAGDYLIDGKINHSAFYGYVSYEYDDCKLTGDGEDQQEICETKIEEGVSLDKEVELLRQAVYELKTELCNKDNSYEFC